MASKLNHRGKVTVIVLGFLMLIILFVLFSTIGSVRLSYSEIFSALIKNDNKVVTTIVYQIRLPRNILSILVGANLAVSGLLLQAIMRNPLSDPGITGVSSGASVAAIIILLLLPQFTTILPLIAFLGGALACVCVYFMAWHGGLKPVRVVLSGVAVNAILGGIISLLTIFYSDRIQSALLWLNGSLAGKTWNDVKILAIYSFVGIAFSLCCVRSANILALGDEAAVNLGLNLNKTRLLLSIIAVFLAGISTAIVGIVSFVGLIVPHIGRMIIGSNHKYLIPFSIILGSIVLMVADTIARSLLGSLELPVGVIMSIFGGPFFLYLLRKRRSIN